MSRSYVILTTVYFFATYGNVLLQYRHRSNLSLVLLLECIHSTVGAIYCFLMVAVLNHPFARATFAVLGGVSLYVAVVLYDRWNNRRRRRKGLKVAGKVGLRLGRLVIVPEA